MCRNTTKPRHKNERGCPLGPVGYRSVSPWAKLDTITYSKYTLHKYCVNAPDCAFFVCHCEKLVFGCSCPEGKGIDNLQNRLLVVVAHPDDEAFGTGGTLSLHARRGVEATLVCATRGEAGEIADPELATPETLGQVRTAELECAAEIMGIRDLIFLDYRDSGMAGTPDNEHPRAFINAPAEQVVTRLVEIIRGRQPHVVVTADPKGGYGHPDHVAVHRHTVAAFRAAADPGRCTDSGEAWQADRLFYSVIPHSFFVAMRGWLVSVGVDTSDLDRYEEMEAGWPDDLVNVSLDVSAVIDTAWAALNCHRTQFGPDNPFRRFPEDVVKQAMSHEHFALAWPEPEPGFKLPDLFSGLESG